MSKEMLSIADIEKMYEKKAETVLDSVTMATDNISMAGRKFTTPDGQTGPGPLRLIILDYVNANFLYPPYRPNQINRPICWAFGNVKHKDLVPESNVPEAKKCGSSCAEVPNWQKLTEDEKNIMVSEQGVCPWAQWGSDKAYHKGKECKASILAAVTLPNPTPDSPVYLLRINRSSLKNFYGFVIQAKNVTGKHFARVTVDVGFDPDKDFNVLKFSNIEVHDSLQAINALSEDVDAVLTRATTVTTEDDDVPF